ncbi:MAG: hypothetical protein RL033_5031, partial [Pseudomonadota bacterium]
MRPSSHQPGLVSRTAFGAGLVLLSAVSIGAGCAKKDTAQPQEPAAATSTATATEKAAAVPVAPRAGGAGDQLAPPGAGPTEAPQG